MKLKNVGQQARRNCTSSIHKKTLYNPSFYDYKYYWDEVVESKDYYAPAIEEHITDQIDYCFHTSMELSDETHSL